MANNSTAAAEILVLMNEEEAALMSNVTMISSSGIMDVENCTRIFGNRTLAQTDFNVTCLEHAPTLNKQVS